MVRFVQKVLLSNVSKAPSQMTNIMYCPRIYIKKMFNFINKLLTMRVRLSVFRFLKFFTTLLYSATFDICCNCTYYYISCLLHVTTELQFLHLSSCEQCIIILY